MLEPTIRVNVHGPGNLLQQLRFLTPPEAGDFIELPDDEEIIISVRVTKRWHAAIPSGAMLMNIAVRVAEPQGHTAKPDPYLAGHVDQLLAAAGIPIDFDDCGEQSNLSVLQRLKLLGSRVAIRGAANSAEVYGAFDWFHSAIRSIDAAKDEAAP